VAPLIASLALLGCGSTASDPNPPLELVEQPKTIGLGLIGAPLAVDGNALVHVTYRRDETSVVRRDLRSGTARTLLRRPVEPWSVERVAARDGRVAVEMSAPLDLQIAHRVLEAPPRGGRPTVLARASDRTGCGAKVSLHGVNAAREVLVSRVRLRCGNTARGELVLRLHTGAGARTVLRRRLSPARAGRLIIEPVLRAGVGGGRIFVADPQEIEIVEPTGRRLVIEARSGEVFAGTSINDRGDVLFHAASGARLRTSLLGPAQTKPLVLAEGSLDRHPGLQLCGGLIISYVRRGSGRAELAVARTTDAKRYRRLRAWPARLADAEVVCDEERAVLIRQQRSSGPSSAEAVRLPK
jgi:hypothetical protein